MYGQQKSQTASTPSSPKYVSDPKYSLPSSPPGGMIAHPQYPPSIPRSLDGEEGATAYSKHLQQSNMDTKPECYQPPPNRTIHRRPSDDIDILDNRSFGSPIPVDKSSVLKRCNKGALPAVPYQYSVSNDDVDTGDYVSSALLSSWRSSSSDRTATRDSKQQQQRSSSADSVKRMVKRLFSSKKSNAKVPALKSDSQLGEQGGLDRCGGMSDCADLKIEQVVMKDVKWDLPPNYVDLIFTKDPITNERHSELVDDEAKCEHFHKV